MLELIAGLLERGGYLGLALLMFIENVFPPIPSELIMPLAGFSAARGELDLAMVVLSGSAGSLAGATFWYLVGRRIGPGRLRTLAERHGRWLALDGAEIDAASAWFLRHGRGSVLLGRLVPAVRTLISVPAAVAGMPLAPFLICSSIGTGLWCGLLAGGGYLLGERYQRISDWLNPVSNAVVGVLLAWYLYRVVTFAPRRPG